MAKKKTLKQQYLKKRKKNPLVLLLQSWGPLAYSFIGLRKTLPIESIAMHLIMDITIKI